MPLIVSVMGTSREEFARLVEGGAGREEVAALELNVSCPNVNSGLIVGEQPEETGSLLEALRPLTEKPLIVKLTPNVADPAAVADAAEEGGADAVSLINTMRASAIDPATRRPWLGGRARRPLRPRRAADRAGPGRRRRRRDPVPGDRHGGRRERRRRAEMVAAGATLVAVGTESFRDPTAGNRVAASSPILDLRTADLDLRSRSR